MPFAVNHDAYVATHRRHPRGFGCWSFTTGIYRVDLAPMTLTRAKAHLRSWLRYSNHPMKNGAWTVAP